MIRQERQASEEGTSTGEARIGREAPLLRAGVIEGEVGEEDIQKRGLFCLNR